MKCLKCHFENREGAKFCKKCGGKLELSCPSCRSPCEPGDSFCDQCGHNLKPTGITASVDYTKPQSYTPKFLAEKILTDRSRIEGERKIVTILFADVADSTAMFENLDPEVIHEIMDGCFRILMDEIHRYEGTINQFTGDGVMALFGAPIAHEDHAQRACHASLAIQRSMATYRESLKAQYGIDFKMRIGLNSGPVVVGSIGDDLRMDYTAQGDTANLAARMEHSAEPGSILASGHMYRQAKEFFEFEPLGEIQVKGKKGSVEAYRLIRQTEVETRIAASAAKGLTRFVGRTRELETLKEALKKVQSGEGQVVGIVGEAGVGKSRLLLEFRNLFPEGEYTYFEGRCLHYGGSMPYLPILDVLRTFIGVKEGQQEHVVRQKLKERVLGVDENLKHVIPPLQELFSLKVSDEEFSKLEPKQKREKTFDALRDLLVRGSQDRPLVLVVEDLHWIDKTSEEFLSYMIGGLPKTRILLLLLHRPEYTHQWGSKSYYSMIVVGQLSMSTSAELVAAILEGGDVVPELRELILNRAAGNPLFMEELTHSLLQNGSIQKKDDRFVLTRELTTEQVPDTIQGIIAARMDRLEESLKRIMQVAAVIGREFAFRILETITEMKEDLKSGLINLQGLEFIYEKSLFPELEYIFRHALVQEVAYNSLLVNRRKEIHEKIGSAIERLYPTRLEEFCEMIAYHYFRSGNLRKAYQYLKASAEKAVRSDALSESIRFYKEALQVLSKMDQTDENKRERINLTLSMHAPVRRMGWSMEDYLPILQEAEEITRELRDNNSNLRVRSLMGLFYIFKGSNPDLGWNYINSSLETPEAVRDIDIMVPLGFNLCASCRAMGDDRRITKFAPGIVRLIETSGKESESFGLPFHPYSFVLAQWGASTGFCGDFSQGQRLLEKALSSALQTGHLATIGIVEFNYGGMLVVKGDGQRGREHLENAIKHLESSNTAIFFGPIWAMLGYAYSLLGEIGAAVDLTEKGVKIHTDLGLPFWRSLCHWCCCYAHFEANDLENARAHVDLALKSATDNNDRAFESLSKMLSGAVLVRFTPSKIAEAEKLFGDGIEIAEKIGLRAHSALGYLLLGKAYLESGIRESAVNNLKKAESLFREMGMDYWLGKAQGVLAKL